MMGTEEFGLTGAPAPRGAMGEDGPTETLVMSHFAAAKDAFLNGGGAGVLVTVPEARFEMALIRALSAYGALDNRDLGSGVMAVRVGEGGEYADLIAGLNKTHDEASRDHEIRTGRQLASSLAQRAAGALSRLTAEIERLKRERDELKTEHDKNAEQLAKMIQDEHERWLKSPMDD